MVLSNTTGIFFRWEEEPLWACEADAWILNSFCGDEQKGLSQVLTIHIQIIKKIFF